MKKIMFPIISAASMVIFAAFLFFTCKDENLQDKTDYTFAFDRVHMYTNVAIPQDKAKEFGVTVNGLWNGWGMKSPVASMHPGLILWRLKSNREYIDQMNRAGFYFGTTLSNTYLHSSLLKKHVHLEKGTCKTITGKSFEINGGFYLGKQPFMCQNSSYWQDFMINRAKEMIDAGADMIVFDEPFGDTFFAALMHPDFPGFSEWDIDLFFHEILDNYTGDQLSRLFALDKPVTKESLTAALAKAPWESWLQSELPAQTSSPAGRLWQAYRKFQIRQNYLQKKELVQAIRAYSREKRGVEIPIGANLAGLESYSLFSFQLPMLYLAGLFDFIAPEAAYRPPLSERMEAQGKKAFDLTDRAKWYAWYALGESFTGPHKTLIYPSQELVNSRLEPEKKSSYLGHLIAEAYASRGGLVIPLFEMSENDEKKVKDITNFIKNNADLYESLDLPAKTAILYAHGENSTERHWSYLGTAQALYESSIPFSVLFTSQDNSDRAPLTLEKLAAYDVVILPISSSVTGEDRKKLLQYVKQGGNLLIFDSNNSFPGADKGENQYGKGKVVRIGSPGFPAPGEDYFNTYTDRLRQNIADQVLTYLPGKIPAESVGADRKWTVLTYTQKKQNRLVLHVINYDYNEEEDSFIVKKNCQIRLKSRAFGFLEGKKLLVKAYSPGSSEPEIINYKQEGDNLVLTLPELEICGVLTVETQ